MNLDGGNYSNAGFQPMGLSDILFGTMMAAVALAAFVVALRLLIFALRCRAKKYSLAMILGGVATLAGISFISLYDGFDNVIQNPNIPTLPSAWFTGISWAIITVWFELFGRFTVERTAFERQLQELATIDPLTGILNRRAFIERGEAIAETARRFGHPSTVLMIDVDHFKQVNDQFGHEMGDKVLRLVVDAIKGCLRHVDVFGRLGGEEFVVVMPETSGVGAHIAAERIREAVRQTELRTDGRTLSVTVSIGASVGLGPFAEALNMADKSLYRAKNEGRNRVVLFERV